MSSQDVIEQAAYSQLAAKERKYQEEQAARFYAMLREESRLRNEVNDQRAEIDELQSDLAHQTIKSYLFALAAVTLAAYEAIRFFN